MKEKLPPRQELASFFRTLAVLPESDLRSLLMHVYSTARYDSGRIIDYHNDDGCALSLSYYTDGRIREILPGAELKPVELEALREGMECLRGPDVERLYSFYSFSFLPVKGRWRYRDRFQITPPPEGAPLPPFLVADWPFVLEVRFSAPDYGPVYHDRQTQAVDPIRLLLPLIFVGPKFVPHFRRSQKHWVAVWRDGGPPPAPVYGQEYYHVEGLPADGSDLSDVFDVEPMAVVEDASAYYEQRGISVGDVLRVPAIATQLFDNFFGLGLPLRKRFLRACYWFNLGRFFFSYSYSASFFAYVVAIESMLDDRPPHRCDSCGMPHHPSITAAFREFLAVNVPDRAEREEFYAARSKIAHGSKLFESDVLEEFAGFHPTLLQEQEQHNQLTSVCRIALVNWLASHAP